MLDIITYAAAKHYCDTHASTLTPEQAIEAVANYFEENPNAIVTNEELETILSGYATAEQGAKADTALQEHQSLAEYRKSADQNVIDEGLENRIGAIEGKEDGWDEKQDAIEDLETIRSGAALGATALQEHQDLSGKQDTLIAGDNIAIAADGKTISAVDTKYTITLDI